MKDTGEEGHTFIMNKADDYNTYNFKIYELLCILFLAGILDYLIFYMFYKSVIVCIVMCIPIALKLTAAYKEYRIDKRKSMLSDGFEELLSGVASALHAGYSLENAFAVAEKELAVLYESKHDIIRETKRICNGIRINRTVTELITDLAKRSGIDDIISFSEILVIAKKSGGNLIAIVKQTADNIHDKREIEQEINAIISGKRLEYRIMCVMPAAMLMYLSICSPGYLTVMYGNFIGVTVMTVCLLIYFFSYCIAEKIMTFGDKSIKVRKKNIFYKSTGVKSEYPRIYRILMKTVAAGKMNSLSEKVAGINPDKDKDTACREFWSSFGTGVYVGMSAAVFIIVIGFIYVRESFLYICVLAAVIMAAIPYMTCKRVDSKLKERNERLLLGYPELINRFLLLLGAGSSMKGAWERLVYDYMKKKESNNSYYDYVYEEMRYSLSELKRGISEILVYERFGRRVRLMPYMKLCSMLSQNLRRGNRYILDQLKLSSLDAYEKKRENIKKLGEEASSKLLLPMMLQFILVLVIIMFPALMSI